MKVLALVALVCIPAFAFASDKAQTIVQKGRVFHPAEVTIDRGGKLTFTNDDQFIHQIYVSNPSFSFETEERAPGQNVTETFSTPGTFEVRCRIHPKMKLLVHVSGRDQ